MVWRGFFYLVAMYIDKFGGNKMKHIDIKKTEMMIEFEERQLKIIKLFRACIFYYLSMSIIICLLSFIISAATQSAATQKESQHAEVETNVTVKTNK